VANKNAQIDGTCGEAKSQVSGTLTFIKKLHIKGTKDKIKLASIFCSH
jgi:hypothetical protein